MTRLINQSELRSNARFAGILYFIIAMSGAFSIGYLPSIILAPGDGAATTQNLLNNMSLFKLGFVADTIVFLLEVILTVVLYKLLKSVNSHLSLIAMFSRMAMAVIMGLNLIAFIVPLYLVNNGELLQGFHLDQIQSFVLLSLEIHEYGIYMWGLFFALHLAVLGYLVYKSELFPKLMGMLMMIGSVGYLAESLTKISFVENEVLAGIVGVFLAISVIGELSFTFWLMIKGVKIKK